MARHGIEAYNERGFNTRREYLESLAVEYDVDEDVVFALASFLGANEDFDGLITSLEDCDYLF